MERFFLEGDQTSKRVRLNQSEILAYGTRKPTGSPVMSTSKHLNCDRDRGRDCSTDPAHNIQSALMLLTFKILQKLLQQTNLIANEILQNTQARPPNYTQGTAPKGEGDLLYMTWQELASIRRDLDLLIKCFASPQPRVPETSSFPAPEELLDKTTRFIEKIERKLASMPGASMTSSNSSGHHKTTRNHDHNKQSEVHSKPKPTLNQPASSAFTNYRNPAPMASCTPTFHFDSYYAVPDVQRLKDLFKDVKVSGYVPDPYFSTRTPRVFGKRKGLETDIDDSLACYRADMNSRLLSKQEKRNRGPQPMEIE